ncbi:hypothetical protein [Bifidobacterium mongoliense]|uniref:hypothetical protein n=1 Tax=Bifidobacterium mongoliense TaxID=518643 RepID=UPI00264A490D|nr:hypothetical protein [Bifidobacterium mongoliense]MDN5633636.1 hypothetical protein [Bifidobacterium mongoliense]MDN6024978.1 hypothetical protein [Bifidobacterium mongoliense]MDN6719942.1 hypothetical protein [Bifidobacterium mongoliense]
MDTFATVLRYVHTTNSWLVLIVGCVAAGVLIVEAVHRNKTKRGGLALGAFALLVYLQVVLGVSTALVKSADSEALFDGNTDKTFWHAALGVGAAILVTLAVWMRRKDWRIAAMLGTIIALVAPSLGRLIPLLLILAICWGVAEILWRRSTPARPPVSSPDSKEH